MRTYVSPQRTPAAAGLTIVGAGRTDGRLRRNLPSLLEDRLDRVRILLARDNLPRQGDQPPPDD